MSGAKTKAPEAVDSSRPSTESILKWLPVVFVLALIAGIVLRLSGLDARSMSHPEIYVPGINLIPGISEPPPRHDFGFALWWHFHDEPHPVGWYMAMFGWTKVFGTSEWALRLPSVIFGAATIVMLQRLAAQIYGPVIGTVAAGLLAVHGFHILWSQAARMYVPGAFLAVLSTWLLIRFAQQRDRHIGLEIGYVVTVVAGVLTIELFWPLLTLHVIWVALVAPAPGAASWRRVLTLGFRDTPRLLQVQSIALMLAAPALSHAVYRARGGAADPPNLSFLTEYFSFGFLFATNFGTAPITKIALPLAAALFCLALLFLCLSVRAKPTAGAYVQSNRGLPVWLPWLVAAASVAFMLWLSTIAHRRGTHLAAISVLPIFALATPMLAATIRAGLRHLLPGVDRAVRAVPATVLLMWLLAVLAPLTLFVISFKLSILAPRAFLVFVPFLLILIAAGAVNTFRQNSRWAYAPALLLTVFAASVPYTSQLPGSPRDYKAIAAAIADDIRPDDLVFVRNRHWADTPLFYYLNDVQFVVSDHAEALTKNPDARVWLITWPNEYRGPERDARHEALAGYTRRAQHTALRASAELFVRE